MTPTRAKRTGCDTLMHCWHVKGSTTDGMGQKGYDDVFCCFCGAVKRRKWHYVKHPNHGTYADLTLRIEGEVE
jgi:hypothetical protein